jgi:hypothetical protein
VSGSLFEPVDGGRWQPTDFARGPWSPDALHGGPVAALLAGTAQPLLDGLQPVRLTIELLRPVPVAPLTASAAVERPGRKVRLAVAELAHGDTAVARASLLGIRRAPVEVPEQSEARGPRPPQAASADVPEAAYPAFHADGVEHRFVAGAFAEPGPATDWIRLRVPVVPGEEPSPLQRVTAAADFGNGVSRIISFTDLLFINPDLTIYLHRLPVGEWVCIEATSRLEPHGIGYAESVLHDPRGRIGRSCQSLLVDTR